MEAGRRIIEKALDKKGYPGTAWNVMTIQDGLQWEDREDYDTVVDAVDAVIEDSEAQLKK